MKHFESLLVIEVFIFMLKIIRERLKVILKSVFIIYNTEIFLFFKY